MPRGTIDWYGPRLQELREQDRPPRPSTEELPPKKPRGRRPKGTGG